MNNLEIYFDGILQNNNDFDGTESVSFVYRKKTEGGESAFSFSPELTVRGAAYDYLVQEIINKPNPKLENIKVLIYDLCCLDSNGNPRQVFDGLIEGADVRWCLVPFCEATVTVIDDSEDAQAIKCLKNTFPWDTKGRGIRNDGYDQFRIAPEIVYCDDIKPSSSHEAVMVLGIIFFILFAPIIALINLIGVISGDASNYINDLGYLITACGKRHLAPYVHSQLYNMCQICGIGLQSSLFEPGGYYHDTIRLDASYVPDSQPINSRFDPLNQNKPNLNGVQFLDEFKQFNIDWRVVNNVLIIERKDYFNGGLWFDATLLPTDSILSLCVEATDIKPAAYAEYEYAQDRIDLSGDEVALQWVDRVIDWNVPINPVQSGLFSKKLTFSAAQFRYDTNAYKTLPIDLPGYVFFYPVLQEYQNDSSLVLSQGLSNFPKLLDVEYIIVNGNRTVQNRGIAVVRKQSVAGSNLRAYNVRWWIKEQPFVDANGVSHDTAYQRLFCIDDPRNNSIKIRRFTLTVTADCDLVRGISVDKTVRMSIGDGQVEEITYDTTNNSLTIVGKV
jgi:hypothetical protein